jgi:type VI secretion system protein ImpG
MVQFQPTLNDAALNAGYVVPERTELRARSKLAPGSVCQYRTAHAVKLWPIFIESVAYTSVLGAIADVRVPSREPIRALLRIRLRVTGGRTFDQLRLRSLPLYLAGADDISTRLYESLVTHAGTLVLRWGPRPAEHVAFGDTPQSTRQYGFDDDQALLPGVPALYRGCRLLHEYFAFPARFRSVELLGLGSGIARADSDKLEIIVPLTQHEPALEGPLEVDRLRLYATPVVNLFSRRCDLAMASDGGSEIQIIPDRTQPLDLEVHSVTRVAARLPNRDEPLEYHPLHADIEGAPDSLRPRYTIERRPRIPLEEEFRSGSRTDYLGSEVFLKLREPTAENRQLVVDALCTNRDLPLLLARDGRSEFTISSGAPVDSVRCIAGPSSPRDSVHDGDTAWRLVNHLNSNYLSLSDATGGSAAVRETLALYANLGDPALRREVDGLRAIDCQSVIGPLPQAGPRTFVRGLEVHLHFEEQAFAHGALTLATVLSIFFANKRRHIASRRLFCIGVSAAKCTACLQ